MPEKYYVAGLDPKTNSVIVARGRDNPTLFARGLSVLETEFNWVAGSPPAELVQGGGGFAGGGRGRSLAVEARALAREGKGVHSNETAQPGAGGAEARERSEMTEGVGGRGAGGVFRCQYRCRHRQELLPCTVEVIGVAHGSSDNGNSSARADDGTGRVDDTPVSLPPSRSTMLVHFDKPAKAIAPGQVVALYKDGVCLGGGPILRAEEHCSPVLVRSTPRETQQFSRQLQSHPKSRECL